MRWFRWEREDARPKHPYRDTAIFYALLAGLIVLITAVTNGNLLPGSGSRRSGVLRLIASAGAIPVAAAFFVLATAFTWWRWRTKQGPAKKGP